MAPGIFRPATIADALALLSEHGASAHLAAGIPPARAAIVIDVSRLAAMTGLDQHAGWITIGLNVGHDALAHSSLIRQQAACLAEACDLALAHRHPTLRLGDDLVRDAAPSTLVALLALDAEIQIAASEGALSWAPLDSWLTQPPAPPTLPIAVRFPVWPAPAGSAFWAAQSPRTLAPNADAIAARLRLDDAGRRIVAAAIALGPADGPPLRLSTAEAMLIGQPLNIGSIEGSASLAHQDLPDPFPARAGEPVYPVHIAPHLVRNALDRALARARAAAPIREYPAD